MKNILNKLKEKFKDKRFTKFVCNIVFFISVIVILLSGTLAKYVSDAFGRDSTLVAKWAFLANGLDITTLDNNDSIQFNLFETIYDSDGVSQDSDVVLGFIAPGTSGKFTFELKNVSEVSAQYGINFEALNPSQIPIEYSIDGSNWYSDITRINIIKNNNTILDIGSSEEYITVFWRWPFNSDIDKDTSLATTGDVSITVKATVYASQIDHSHIDSLEKKYDLTYVSNFSEANSIISNNQYGNEYSTTYQDTANLAVYLDDNNVPNVVLVKDYNINDTFMISSDMILDLSGKTLICKEQIVITNGCNVIIKGVINKSSILFNNMIYSNSINVINNSSLIIEGGNYDFDFYDPNLEINPSIAISVDSTSRLHINGANINSGNSAGFSNSLYVDNGGELFIEDSTIKNNYGGNAIYNVGTVNINNSNIESISDFQSDSSNTSFTYKSIGINNLGEVTIKNSYAYGSHSGIYSTGTLLVDGGTYEGYAFGGIYYRGSNTTNYLKNATVKYSIVKDGSDLGTGGSNNTALYVGGGSGNKIYIDKCTLDAPFYPVNIKSNNDENNNAVYISNTNALGFSKYFRNDGSTNKIYIGVNNNFDIINTYLESGSVKTNDDYGEIFPYY